MTNILTSHTAKQLLGACAGMAIAGLVYVSVDKVSDFNIKGLLVSTSTVTTNSGTNINAKKVDPDTLRRITSRAQTVATTLENAAEPSQAETPVTNFAEERRAARFAENQRKELAATAKTYSNDPNVVMSETDRLAIRAARIAGLPAPAVAPKPINYPPAPAAGVTATAGVVTVIDTVPMHYGAEIVQTTAHTTNLPNSGLGLNLLVIATLIAAFAMSKTTWRRDLASMMQGLRIG